MAPGRRRSGAVFDAVRTAIAQRLRVIANRFEATAVKVTPVIARLKALEAIGQLKQRYLNACDLMQVEVIRDGVAEGAIPIDGGPWAALSNLTVSLPGTRNWQARSG